MSSVPLRVLWLGVAAPLACAGEARVPAGTGGSSADSGAPRLDAGQDASSSELECAVASARPERELRRGEALAVGALADSWVPVTDPGGSFAVDGAARLVQSQLAGNGPITTPATLSSAPGKLCLSGNTVLVPLMNFTDYWGAQIFLYLLREGAATAVDAGGLVVTSPLPAAGDAGGPARFVPWSPADRDVIGVSFTVEGNNPELPCNGLPPLLRLQAWPAGGDPNDDIYCSDLRGLVDGQVQDVLFSEIVRECWEPGGRGIFEEPRPAGFTGDLFTLQWLVPAAAEYAFPFDLCISDIRPILGG